MKRQLNLKNASTQVHDGTYDDATKELELELNGGTYRYKDVSADEVFNLENAPSPGDYFHGQIKHHKFEKVQ